MIICLGWPSPTTSSSLPAAFPHPNIRGLGLSVWVTPRRLFGLAPTGGYPATAVASGAVGSYPTVSPLPLCPIARASGRSIFCGPFRRLAAPRRYLAVYPMELGLSSDTLRRPRSSRLTSGRNIAGKRGSGEAWLKAHPARWQPVISYLPAFPLLRRPHPACPTRARPC